MQLPIIRGLIARRILANYRVDPAVLKRMLPPPFRPLTVAGWGMAGICLIRLEAVRPQFMRLPLGIASENAAHRIAVEWDDQGVVREGVYIARRDTSSRFNALVGGRLFPGEHHYARFATAETAQALTVQFASADGTASARVSGQPSAEWPADSIFPSQSAASDFFARGALGYSVTRDPQRFDGLELQCQTWQVEPLALTTFESSFFADPRLFPPGSLQADCALLMRNIPHEWHGRPQLCS